MQERMLSDMEVAGAQYKAMPKHRQVQGPSGGPFGAPPLPPSPAGSSSSANTNTPTPAAAAVPGPRPPTGVYVAVDAAHGHAGRRRPWCGSLCSLSKSTRGMCIKWGVILYAALLAVGALMAIAMAVSIRPALQSADAAIGKIDRIYTDLQTMLRVVCGTPGLLPPDVWPIVCNILN